MIDALNGGKIYGQPAQRTAKTGKPFAVAKVRVSAGDGEGVFVNVIAFDAAPCAAHPALDIVAHQVLTPYHVQRKRRAVADSGGDRDAG